MPRSSEASVLPHLKRGRWLGIDIGSARRKICCLCWIASDGRGRLEIAFEQGPADGDYPSRNTREALLDVTRAPTYLRRDVEDAVVRVLENGTLFRRWLQGTPQGASAVAVDAPVAWATEGGIRWTETASTQTITTPDQETFEALLRTKGDPYLRVNVFWKCVGLAIYRAIAHRLVGSKPPDMLPLAALTCPGKMTPWRLRETFPSDVYKRANGTEGVLAPAPRRVLEALVEDTTAWRGAGSKGCRPTRPTMDRLRALGDAARDELMSQQPLPTLRKHGGICGDLWDAFTCAFTACCEDHHGARFHGLEEDSGAIERLRREGVIMTVQTASHD